jgi:mannose-6-phosphate isomerase-like protein (cupin superfamily)
MNIAAPVVVSEHESSWGQVVKHRGGGRRSVHFGFYDQERSISMNAGMTVYNHERMNPRHKHDFDQVRYFLKGGENYSTHEVLRQGDAIYVPEGVSYGPTYTEEGCDENIRFTMQFPGVSQNRILYHASQEYHDAQEKLAEIGKVEKGLFVWPDGRKQDSAEAIREYVFGRKIEYPKSRYNTYVVMHTPEYNYEPLENVAGVQVKHLGYFNEAGPNIKLVGIDAGASTPAGKAGCEQIRLLIEGDISYDGKEYQAVSCMYFPANVPYSPTSSKKGAILFVVQVGSQEGKRPPFCLI